MALTCPRDGAQLQPSNDEHVSHQQCPKCKGGWFALDEFERLEATVASSDAVAGTIEYATRDANLKCPSCGKEMAAFDFRGQNLELDACNDEHGFWLDAGESERVRDIMRQRVLDLARSAKAEGVWNAERERGFSETFVQKIKNAFRRGL
jgi:Zn-finger nucleic acid-binding protein